MSENVKGLIGVGFKYYSLNRIEIRCAADNHKSRAIAERLGFQQEGIVRLAEKAYGKYLDHIVYGLLKLESRCQQGI